MFINARAIIEKEDDAGSKVLLQIRNKSNEPKAFELPGGRIEEYESIAAALYREVYEETGLKVKIADEIDRNVYSNERVAIEGLKPFFVYQTLEGPVDSIGYIFRCSVESGKLENKSEASSHQWFSLKELDDKLRDDSDTFDFLTRGLIDYYLRQKRAGYK